MYILYICSATSCSATKLYPTLCDPMDQSMPDFPILYIGLTKKFIQVFHNILWKDA